jgi:hypothetical protein
MCVCARVMEHGIDLVKMITPPPIQSVIMGNGEKSFPCVPFFCEEDCFWSRFSLS